MGTKIEWTDETWNPVTGCSKVSSGCKNCYAERMAKRLAGRFGYPEDPKQFDVTLRPYRLEEPLRWRKPRKIFVCSMSDLFHPEVPFFFVDKVIAIIQKKYKHRFQILTKRPGRMREYFSERLIGEDRYAYLEHAYREMDIKPPSVSMWPMPWLWLGVTAENQETADERIPVLLDTPAAVRFVSVEPMLGSIDLDMTGIGRRGIDWVIAGGESGPGARPPKIEWFRSIRDQCVYAGVPFFFKQWGGPHHKGWVIDSEVYSGNVLDGETWHQFPGGTS